jgi:acetyl-CoA carboxylase carboxyl transferase subunit beta
VKEIFRRRPKYLSLPERTNDASHRVPDNMWISCPRCHELLYAKEYEDNFKVCSKCKYHFRLSPQERLAVLLDEGTFEERDAGLCSADPLHFVAGEMNYAAKLDENARKAGTTEALIYGRGAIEGRRVVIAVHNASFLAGSMGVAVGEKVARAIDLAVDDDVPLIIVAASGGARMQEGVYSLVQMAKTVAALDRLKSRHLPYISILTDPTVGGVPASYALLGDVNIAEPGAFIGFAGPRVIEQAAKKKLPEDVNTAEFMLEHGMVDAVVQRADLRSTLAGLLGLLAARTYRPDAGHGYAALRMVAGGARENGRHG